MALRQKHDCLTKTPHTWVSLIGAGFRQNRGGITGKGGGTRMRAWEGGKREGEGGGGGEWGGMGH